MLMKILVAAALSVAVSSAPTVPAIAAKSSHQSGGSPQPADMVNLEYRQIKGGSLLDEPTFGEKFMVDGHPRRWR